MVNKIFRAGDSAAVTLPKKMLHEMGCKIGDSVILTFFQDENEVNIRPVKKKRNQLSSRIAKLTTNFIDRYRPALDELAK